MNFNDPFFALDFFPARVGTMKVSAHAMRGSGAVAGAMSSDGDAYIPIEDTAYMRNVRRHESLHAIWSRSKVDPTALGQGIEDMRIHVLGQPTINERGRRDEILTSLKDLRDIQRGMPKLKALTKTNPASARINLIPLVRAAAILSFGMTQRRDGQVKLTTLRRTELLLLSLIAAFEKMIGRTGLNKAINQAVAALRDDDKATARAALRPFMTLPNGKEPKPSQPKQSDQKQSKSKESKNEKKEKSEPSQAPPPVEQEDPEPQEQESDSGDEDPDVDDRKSEDGEGESSGDECGDDIPCTEEETKTEAEQPAMLGGIGGSLISLEDALKAGIITPESVAMLPLEVIQALLASGGDSFSGLPKMKIHKLDFSKSKRITEGRSDKPQIAGAKIRARRLHSAVTPNPGRIFLRRRKNAGGTVLIDASGSMALNNERLSQLAERLPIGQVAYYSGDQPCQGVLVIYSKDHRCYSLPAGATLPHHYCGNEVDFAALQWLLKQPAPRWFITDCGFCGSDLQTTAAKLLMQRTYDRKLLKHQPTLGHLELELGLIDKLTPRDIKFADRMMDYRIDLLLKACRTCAGDRVTIDGRDCPACNGTGMRGKK